MRFLVSLIAMLVLPVIAAAQDRPNTILVLDGSGSMWGQIDGVNKIVIARDVIGELLQNFPSDQNLGLTAYGHRTRGDCADIETLVQPGAGTLPAIASAVNGINPRGKTPMTDAVIAAAEALRFTEEKATVILVSDGIETCHPDPCAAARVLEEAGIDFTAHVVGFDVTDPAALAQMQCLAGETGGTFTQASNAGELIDALSTVVAEPVYVPQTVQIAAVLRPGGPEIAEPVRWNILPTAGGANIDGAGPGYATDLPEGAYDIVGIRESDGMEVGLIFEVAALEVDQGQRVEVIFPEPAPEPVEVAFRAVIGSEDGPLIDTPVLWDLSGEEGVILDGVQSNPLPELMVEGSYTVSAYWVAQEVASQPRQFIVGRTPREITVVFEPPRETATVTAPATAVAGSTIEVGWNGSNGKDDYLGVGPAGAERGDRWTNYTYTREGNPLQLQMPLTTGAHTITYFKGEGREALGATSIEITPLEVTLTAPAGAVAGSVIEVGWTGPDYRDDYIAIGLEGATGGDRWRNYTYTREGAQLKLLVPPEPGRYLITYFASQDRTPLRSVPIEVSEVVASVTAPASAVAGAMVEIGWTGPDAPDDYIGVGPQGATSGSQWMNYTYTREGAPLMLQMPPEPGTYAIQYFLSQDRTALVSTSIELTAPEISVTAPSEAIAGSMIEVGWVGPGYRDDYIGIGRLGAGSGSQWETYTYTREGQPLQVRVPSTPGDYQVTYFMSQDRTAKTSAPLRVLAAEASLVAPASAVAGSTVEIGWTGPGYRDDFVAVGPEGATGGTRWQGYTYVRKGNPVQLKLPEAPGNYVLRYFMDLDRTVLAETPITLQ